MNTTNSYTFFFVCLCLSFIPSTLYAGNDNPTLSVLLDNETLTPLGAERKGNADGSIPDWQGGLTEVPQNWQPENGYTDPYANESVLFTITKDNYGQYQDKLTSGLIALLQSPKDFKMPVYPGHRSFANPSHVYDATIARAGQANVEDASLKGHRQPGIPFPVPNTAEEVMFNHLNGWIGGVEACTDWFPVYPNGSYYRVGWCSTIIQASEMNQVKDNNDSFYFLGRYDSPSSLIGTVYLVHETMYLSEGARRAWIYNSGQRRVRRAPNLAYDNVADGSESMTTIDDAGGFNGALDRYDWRLMGKQEIYIPYNAYKLGDPSLKYDDIIDGAKVRNDLMRFELHRVWKIEATLKDGMSHIYQRRIFYIDEDSWKVVLTESYDSKGELWRTSLHPLIQLYDVPVMIQRAGIYHDLISGSMLLNGLDNERKQPAMQWHVKGRLSDFRSSALRR